MTELLTREQIREYAGHASIGSPSELVWTTESPSITASEIARQTQAEARAAAVEQLKARLDNGDE